MAWFLRGVQSAVFHYVSCAPCIQYASQKKRRKQAKVDREARMQLEKEQPGVYSHPEPTGTNPFWQEEITLGPGPPPRRGKKSSSQRGIVRAGTHSTIASQGSSSTDVNDHVRLSEDTLDDDNWNRKRYQREDEYLWGLDGPILAIRSATTRASSIGISGVSRPSSSLGSTKSYYTARVPPVNDLHPPVVSLPSPNPEGNQWMLQPPPKASVMSGKERATRSRSGSSASSRVELSLQRQASARNARHRLEYGAAAEISPISRTNSYNNRSAALLSPNARPPSATSSRRKQRRDTAWSVRPDHGMSSAGNSSSDTIARPKRAQTTKDVSNMDIVQIRSSRQRLSTVFSSGEARSSNNDFLTAPGNRIGNRRIKWASTQQPDSSPYLMKHRVPLTSSDVSSLNALQDLVPPRALLNNRFVSAPLIEARIKLPPSSADEERTLTSDDDEDWAGSRFGSDREWSGHMNGPVPFDSLGPAGRDPRLRWSVDF
ncbi:hypothetical protein BU24DRAFT_357480 [Aaosphaeria arxii CBS 175.79]|uniref:Signal peptide-containing protein n=1 Tax=Aaosphaeria arxii CBS 175.79 TaxID=1450172 RepID=A0A6A5XAI2_9PLEO|nr:uncharacterized protein BU24DRAFT_357480 [Aaosphaeria arxii CBS 175.79]KAF2009930.1 hypothetical protein BU24DRAFT_357480 [Aaosphaeria arxii CBS 175.79]